MTLKDEWFVEFDKETIDTRMQTGNFALFAPAERDILPAHLNQIPLSHVDLESILMKHLISQLNIMHNFLTTEAIANDDPHFQRYARKMLNYTKAELNYCYNFWQNDKYLDYMSYRINATLLRTYYFLLDFHRNVVKRKTIENRSYWSMNESLEDLSGYLALRAEDLVSLILYFEKSYENLHGQVSPFYKVYPLEVSLVTAIWGISSMYIEENFKEIYKYGKSKFTEADENKLKQSIFTSNRGFRERIIKKEKTIFDAEKDAKEYLLGEMLQSRYISKLALDSERQITPPISKAASLQYDKNDKRARQEAEEEELKRLLQSNYIERLKESTLNPHLKGKLLAPNTHSNFDNHGLSSVSSMKFSTLADLSKLSTVKDSPNNPLAKSALMNNFISDMGEEHDLRIKIAKESKMITRQNIISHFNRDILKKGSPEELGPKTANSMSMSWSYENDQQRAMYSKQIEDNEYIKTVKTGLDKEDLYKSLIGEGSMMEESNEDVEKQKKQPKGLFRNLKLMNKQKMLGPLEKKNDKKKKKKKKKKTVIIEDGDEDDDHDDGNKKKKKLSKKKQREEEILKMAAETVMNDQLNYQPSKENKGDDIPDEEALDGLEMDDEDDESVINEEDEEDEEEDKESSEGQKEDDENEAKDEDKNSDEEEEDNRSENSETDEQSHRTKKKKEKLLKELAAEQLNVSRNEFQTHFEETTQKERKNLRSKYFLPGRNLFNLSGEDDINVSRHKSKWCFLQDNYMQMNVEKICNMIKSGEDAQESHTLLDRKSFRQKMKKMKRDLSKPFPFAKQNQLAIFQDIFGVLPIEPIVEPQVRFIGLPNADRKKEYL